MLIEMIERFGLNPKIGPVDHSTGEKKETHYVARVIEVGMNGLLHRSVKVRWGGAPVDIVVSG